MNAKIVSALVIVGGAVVVSALLYITLSPVETAPRTTAARGVAAVDAEKTGARKIPGGDKKVAWIPKTSGEPSAKSHRPVRQAPVDWFAKLESAADRELGKRIQDAQDADDGEAIFKAADDALKSECEEVRQAAVEAVAMQGGEPAVPLLLNFVNDKSSDVADSAYRGWDDAVDAMEDDFRKLDAIRIGLSVVKSEEHVKSAVGKIEMLDAPRAIRELANLAKAGGAQARAAKESYENVTGEKFESWAAAELKAMAIDRANAQ